MNRNLALGLLAALAAALIGSGWQIASRHGVTTTLGPLEIAVLRYGVPALVLLPLLLRTGLLPPGLPRRRLGLMVLGGGLPFGLLVLAGRPHGRVHGRQRAAVHRAGCQAGAG